MATQFASLSSTKERICQPGLRIGERQYSNGLTSIDERILQKCRIFVFGIERFFGREHSSLFHELRTHVRSGHPQTKEQIPTTSTGGLQHGNVLSRLDRKCVTEPSVSNSCSGEDTTFRVLYYCYYYYYYDDDDGGQDYSYGRQ